MPQTSPSQQGVKCLWSVLPHPLPEHQRHLKPTEGRPSGHLMTEDRCQLPLAHHTAHQSHQDTAARRRRAREQGCIRHHRWPGGRLHRCSRQVLWETRSRAQVSRGAEYSLHAPTQLPTRRSQHSPKQDDLTPARCTPGRSAGLGREPQPLIARPSATKGRQRLPRRLGSEAGVFREQGPPMLSRWEGCHRGQGPPHHRGGGENGDILDAAMRPAAADRGRYHGALQASAHRSPST